MTAVVLHAVAVKPDPFQRSRIFTLAQMRGLEADLGVTGDRKLRKEIIAAGMLYRMFLTVQDTKSPKRGRAELDPLIKALGEAEAAFDQLGLWARSDLNDELRKMLGNDLSAANATAGISSVWEAAKRVRAKLPAGAGRPHLDVLRQLCEQLADVYEKHTGKCFTFDAHRENGEMKFVSPGAAWVARVVRLVDPEVTATNLETALRYLRKPIEIKPL